MKVTQTAIAGVLIIEPKVFGDHRGFFMEAYHQERYADHGIRAAFVQDNLSYSQQGVLRGLHFQNPRPQGKLVQVLHGEVFDVAVDLREGSPTFGSWVGISLSAENKKQFYVPPGLAHGFVVTSETALFAYKCTDFYQPENEGCLLWNDPELGIDWPVAAPKLSAKDQMGMRLKDLPRSKLVAFKP